MKELEKLLSSLIQRGWKPWGIDSDTLYIHSMKDNKIIFECPYLCVSLRELVSLESGLWQFCVENELTRWYNWDEWKYTEIFPWDYRDYPADEHKYRLLESALTPEKELAQFLIDNIKVAWIMN